MLALNMFEEAGRKEVATPGQLWFAPMEGAPSELTQHRWGGDLSLVSALGSPRHVASFSLKDHIPVLTSLFLEKFACFLSLAHELSNKHLVTFN